MKASAHSSKVAAVWLVIAAIALLSCGGPAPSRTVEHGQAATISGVVFRDLDSDGIRDAREPGEPGIEVVAYDIQQHLACTATSDVSGRYVLNPELDPAKIVADAQYEITFSGWPAPLSPGPHGPDSGTEQQFVVGGTDGVSLGLFSPGQYVPPEATAAGLLAHQTPAPTPTIGATATPSYEGVAPAPDLPSGLDWLNTARPLTWSDLKGKVVLLEFWTYGCINCIQAVPQIKMLEEKYASELVVIGVHSAKFPHEGETENIRHIIERYEIDFPVINDHEYAMATEYGANVWPTWAIVNPQGRYLGSRSGDMLYSQLDRLIHSIVVEFDRQGLLDHSPLDAILARPAAVESPLRFPSDVLADDTDGRLFIVDSGHNRIIVSDTAGKVLEVIGSGQAGRDDGDYQTVTFYRPQGITLAGPNTLYVADTENQLIRRVDLRTRHVTTVAGVGERILIEADSGPALESRLNSPWDVLFASGRVYVAMAGQHQIWTYDPDRKRMEAFAGTGAEELVDGRLLSAGLNQPTALATDGSLLYIADSEASAIRQATLSPNGEVQTLVGAGFYVFGDVDGSGATARLQRPAGLAWVDGLLYIADTYNNKIKTLDLKTGKVQTILGTGAGSWRDGDDPLFSEPTGLSATPDRLYVADTNNHVIRVVELKSRKTSTLVLMDPEGLLVRPSDDERFAGKTVTLEPVTVGIGRGAIQLDIRLPRGYKINSLAPALFRWWSDGGAIVLDPGQARRVVANPTFPLVFNATFDAGTTKLFGETVVYYCQASAERLCLVEQVRFVVPVTASADADRHAITVEHSVDAP